MIYLIIYSFRYSQTQCTFKVMKLILDINSHGKLLGLDYVVIFMKLAILIRPKNLNLFFWGI